MFRLVYSNETNLQSNTNNKHIEGLHRLNRKETTVCVRQGLELIGYKYLEKSRKWIKQWNNQIFEKDGDYPVDKYPWLVTDKLISGKTIIVINHPNGIRLYEEDRSKAGIKLIKEDGNFHDVYKFTTLLGKFYSTEDWIGVLTKNTKGEIKFYAITPDSFNPDENDPAFPLDTKVSLSKYWGFTNTTLFTTKLGHGDTDFIGISFENGLEFYQFNKDYLLERVTKASQIVIPSQKSSSALKNIFFADLTHQSYKDIIFVNQSGLFVYKYDSKNSDYNFISLSVEFTETHGWLPNYSDSIHTLDINGDGYDDLLYTGVAGLKAMTFDLKSESWKIILKSDEIHASRRYSVIVGTWSSNPPSMKHPSIFTQNPDNILEWAEIKAVPFDDSIPHEESTSSTSTSRPSYSLEGDTKLVPSQISRTSSTEKPILHWTDQIENNIFKDVIDHGRGQIQLVIPLVDLSNMIGWNLNLFMSYNSQLKRSDLLGEGWSLSIEQNYIFVDYQGTIFDEDINYYLMVQGRPKLLKQVEIKNGNVRFQIYSDSMEDKSSTVIEYHTKEQFWIVENTSERIVYGKSNHKSAKDALQWSLCWPSWNGPGRDKKEQQSKVTSWYLNMRLDKKEVKELYYFYEMDNKILDGGKSYTSSIRLKTIRDGHEMQLSFDYGLKDEIEYNIQNPIDDLGFITFPVPLEINHYLKGYEVITSTFKQTLNFHYQLNKEKRRLTSITQKFPLNDYILLQFKYKELLGHNILESATLSPKEVTVNFEYDSVTPPIHVLSPNNIYTIPIREKPLIVQAQDYTIIAHKNMSSEATGVLLRITNKEMSETLTVCTANLKSASDESKITNYFIQAYRNSFALYIESDNSKVVYIFNRQKNKWLVDPHIHSFTKQSLVRFSETIIASIDPNVNAIKLVKYTHDGSSWNSTTIPTSKNVKYISLHNKRVICYDDHSLVLFYTDSSSVWHEKILDDSNIGLHTKSKNTLKSFDLSSELQNQLSAILNNSGLQILNNLVSLYSIQERNGQLFIDVHLYLLESNYNVRKHKSFQINCENIYQLSKETKTKDGKMIYHLGYVNDGNIFKVRVKKVSGEHFESIRNKNLRKDEMDRMKKLTNEDTEFLKSSKDIFLLNWSLYNIQISPHGVYCGDDILLRMTGTDWEQHTLSSGKLSLGKKFVLIGNSDDKNVFKLYKQNGAGDKIGDPMKVLQVRTSEQIVNRFPAYIAYQSNANTVEVLTFENEDTLGSVRTFRNEELLQESDWQNILTMVNASATTYEHAEPKECLVRPLVSLIPQTDQVFINQMELTDGEVKRLTGHRHSFHKNEIEFSEIVTIIPGNDKRNNGWYERETIYNFNKKNSSKVESWFDANGQHVPGPPDEGNENSDDQALNATNPGALLFDVNGKWLISDFSPYQLSDEMSSYYGFEPYEKNQIGKTEPNTKSWNLYQAEIIEGGFPFTGNNYLELLNNLPNQTSYIEGKFKPLNQNIPYIASCWIRCTSELAIDSPVSYLKAIIYTSEGREIISLLGKVKNHLRNWFYLELPIDFPLVRKIYRNNLEYTFANSSITEYPTPENVRFEIRLRVEASLNEKIDLDHIRFTPLSHAFQATVYNPTSGQPTAVIQTNGLAPRNIYNRLNEEIGNLQEDEQLIRFSSSSRTGRLVPEPQGNTLKNNKANILTFEPSTGYHEIFDTYSLSNNWLIREPSAWNIAHGQLWHKHAGKHRVEMRKSLFDATSSAIRCFFILEKSESCLSLNWQGSDTLRICRHSDQATLKLPNQKSITSLLPTGELIVMIEDNYMWLWFDGVLLVDQKMFVRSSSNPWSTFSMEAQGEVLIEDLMIMNNPKLKIDYYNAFGEKTQTIQFEDVNTIQVSEVLYDELGRESITTKTTRVKRIADQSLLAYRPNFVTNKNPLKIESVWKTGKIKGEVDSLNSEDQGVPYTQTAYAKNPLNEESELGFPGKDFSIGGRYSIKINHASDIAFLDNLFPSKAGFRQKVDSTPHGTINVSIFDKRNNQVAKYVRVPSYDHLLSTYKYDEKNQLVKILPPLYHEKADTYSRSTVWMDEEDSLSRKEKELQTALATRFVYDENGQLIRKITPDTGTTEYLYNSAGQKRFMVDLNSANETNRIVYFNYDENHQLINSGYLEQLVPLTSLYKYLDSLRPPFAQEYQQFVYSDNHPDPLVRGRTKYFITRDNGESIFERVHFNAQEELISKSSIAVIGQSDDEDQLTDIKKEYKSNKMHRMTYPVPFNGKPLSLIYRYNKIGQLVAIKTNDEADWLINFTYFATGQLASEHFGFDRHHGFTRSYRYNSPGYLDLISDPFLVEEIAYADKGYGQLGYGDGMIMQTAFNASWSRNSDPRWFRVQETDIGGEFSSICINALKRMGYITENGTPIKLYIQNAETTFPLVCGGQTGTKIAQILAEKQRPSYFGHRYSYGNHKELVKAKYFSDATESIIEPLQPNSFARKITSLSNEQSIHIWKILAKENYIRVDQKQKDISSAIGKSGTPFFRRNELYVDLSKLNSNYTLFVSPIEKLIISTIGEQKLLSLTHFENIFILWQGLDKTSSLFVHKKELEKGREIGSMLIEKGYLPVNVENLYNSLDKKFVSVLKEYSKFIPNIVKILSQNCAHELGEMAFDLESFEIDANGNHQLFYSGFNRYELAYHNNTNRIKHVTLNSVLSLPRTETVFPVKHDDQGNVIQALHKGIESIKYHPVSQRATLIKLTDGRTLRFAYDAQGERIRKRVYDIEGKLTKEYTYLRDEKGRVLADRHIQYVNGSIQKIVTAYVYGPRGLVGFFRNNKFFVVTTDHSGSVRLVIDSGKVVSAYDYLPYGEIMRSFGNDPNTHIVYRYTGQEWDEETGLYNYHARLYDPSIGRFYQPDPKAQYFSPYKYAGNSPISTIDPDGELAFLLVCLAFAIVGAYLGGASANNRWNPLDWDFTDYNTYLQMGLGGIAGGFLPVGFVASAGTIGVGLTVGLGIGGAYLGGAAANQQWNPLEWNIDRPSTWSGLFEGFGAGSGIFGGVGLAHNFAKNGKSLAQFAKFIGGHRNLVKGVFLTVSYTGAVGVTYGVGVTANNGNYAFWQWDMSNPATWYALVNGFDTGLGWPQNFLEVGRGIAKLSNNPSKMGKLFKNNPSKRHALTLILTNPQHPLYKVTLAVAMSFFMGGSANSDWDITRWNLASFSTYEGVLNGVFFGKSTSNMLKFSRNAKKKKQTNFLINYISKKVAKSSTTFKKIINNFIILHNRKQYQSFMKQAFDFENSWRSMTKDQPAAVIHDVETFFKKGLQKWKNGETRPPKFLQKLMFDASYKKDSVTGRNLFEWQKDNEKVCKTNEEVFLKEDVPYLSCHSLTKRRRRMPMGGLKRCLADLESIIPKKKDHTKNELIQQFFSFDDPGIARGSPLDDEYFLIQSRMSGNSEGFNPSSPKGFSEHLSLLLDKTPNFLASTKKEFFPSLILGSICTLFNSKITNIRQDVFAKIQTVKINPFRGRTKVEHDILKTSFQRNDNVLVLKTFISEKHTFTAKINYPLKLTMHEHYKKQLTLESRYSAAELTEISNKLGLKGNYNIEEFVYYIDPDNSLSVKYEQYDRNSYDLNPSNTDLVKFEEIKGTPQIDLSKSLEQISSNEITDVQKGIRELSENLLKVYENNKNAFRFDKTSESGFHAFFYGSLSLNFKYRYNLDIFVERIAGRGYADLMMLSRKGKDTNKNWHAVPIVVEFKADKTSSEGATSQASGTGYLYNLGLRTVAKEAIVIGINSNNNAIDISKTNIPQSEGFINQLTKSFIHKDFKQIIKDELKHLYYSISPLASKTKASEQDRYLSRLILGEIISRTDVYILPREDLSTFIYQERGHWIMLNIVERSHKIDDNTFVFKDIDELDTKLPDNVEFNNIFRVDMKINSKSKEGWSLEERKRTVNSVANSENYYFQGLDSSSISIHDIKKLPRSSEFKKMSNINAIENIFKPGEDVSGKNYAVNNMLTPIKDLFESESDFQALLHGLCLGVDKKYNPLDGSTELIKVFPEANPSRGGRIDLVIYKLKQKGSEVNIDDLTIMELKYSGKGQIDALKQLEVAKNQIGQYFINLKTFSDSKKVIPISAVLDQSSGSIQYKVHDTADVHHTTDDSAHNTDGDDPVDTVSNSVPTEALLNLGDYISDIDTNLLDGVNKIDLDKASKKPKYGERKKRSLHAKDNFPVEVQTSLAHLYAETDSNSNINTNLSYSKTNGNINSPPYNIGHQFIKKENLLNTNKSSPILVTTNITKNIGSLDKNIYPHNENEQPFKEKANSSTLFDLGNQWLSNMNLNGLLTWSIILTRKWTGYKDNLTEIPSYNIGKNVELSFESAKIVDDFMNMILDRTDNAEVRQEIVEMFESKDIYFQMIRKVKEKLSRNQDETIPKLLYTEIVEKNIGKIKPNLEKMQYDDFF